MKALKAFRGKLAIFFLIFGVLATNAMAAGGATLSSLDSWWSSSDTADVVSFLAGIAVVLVSIGMSALSLFLIVKMFSYVRTAIK